jgi:hypothetical protein
MMRTHTRRYADQQYCSHKNRTAATIRPPTHLVPDSGCNLCAISRPCGKARIHPTDVITPPFPSADPSPTTNVWPQVLPRVLPLRMVRTLVLAAMLVQPCCGNPCKLTAPTNGLAGPCPASLASGSSCTPTCNSGYTVYGSYSCSAGALSGASRSLPILLIRRDLPCAASPVLAQ